MEDKRNIKPICGVCGTNESDDTIGYCKNGHDYWVELADFDNDDLVAYVRLARKNLNVSTTELWEAIYTGISLEKENI